MNDLRPAFRQFLMRFPAIRQKPVVLVAVSGGADSVALCSLCREEGLPFRMLHCNFGLRGAESERDEDFVRDLASKWNVPLLVQRFDTEDHATRQKLSIQEAARVLRYDWFRAVSDSQNEAPLLTAHHADDNLETLLLNFFRGTGISGLTGIPERNGYVYRPLLTVRKAELIHYLNEQGLSWVEDSSNQKTEYSRNYVRHELLPSIKRMFPAVEGVLLDNMQRLRSVEEVYTEAVNTWKLDVIEEKNGEYWVPVRKLEKTGTRALVFELIRTYGFGEKQVETVYGLMKGETGKFIANESFQIVRHRNWLVIAPRAELRTVIPVEADAEEVRFPEGILRIRRVDKETFRLKKDPNTAQLDSRLLEYPLLLRKWRAGDYFYPFGMRKKKKLARFFIDAKLSKVQKEKIWVLESNRKVVWVVGMRIDDRYRVSDSTPSVSVITWDDQSVR